MRDKLKSLYAEYRRLNDEMSKLIYESNSLDDDYVSSKINQLAKELDRLETDIDNLEETQ